MIEETRYALIEHYKTVGEVRQYLPGNYRIYAIGENGEGIIVAGEDNAGWTLDDYVIPRLGSGLVPAKEVWPSWSDGDGKVCGPNPKVQP